MDQVWDIAYYTEGGFPFEQVYNMPVNVRSYYYKKLVLIKENERKMIEEQTNNRGR